MLIFKIWTICVGVFFLLQAAWTRRFTKSIFLLKNQSLAKFAGDWPKISIIIPACNEEATIEQAAKSLLAVDYPRLELVFVNDRSSDATGRIIDRLALRDKRIKAMHVKELPVGWLGKVNALAKGISHTQSDWILMTDADVHLSPQALQKAIAYCLRNRLDFLTAIPDLHASSLSLQAMMSQLYHQASLFFDPKKLNDPKTKVCYGQGAFLLFKRGIYEQSEKLDWLKMEVIDDTGLALLLRRAGARMGAVSGLDEIRLEWYPHLPGLIRGLEKNGFAFFSYSPWILTGFVLFVWTLLAGFTIAPFLSTYGVYGAFTGLCLAIYLMTIRNQLRQLMKVRILSVLLYPISLALLPLIFVRSAILTLWRKGIVWRGTYYSLEELRSQQRMKLANLVFHPATPKPAMAQKTPVKSGSLGVSYTK